MDANGEDFIKLNALRVEALYNNSVIPVAVTLTGCIVLFFVLMNKQNAFPAVCWLILLITVSVIRYFIVRRYHTSEKLPEDYKHWLNVFLVGAISSGLVLGSAAHVFIIDDNIINIGLLTMFILVLNSGSIGIYSSYNRVYYGFNIPTIVPFVFFLITSNNPLLHKLCIIFLAFIGFIFVIQYHSQRIINQLISVKLDRENLLDSYELDQSRIIILEKMFNTNLRELKIARNELAECQKKLKQKDD